jgi:hypothetical protein
VYGEKNLVMGIDEEVYWKGVVGFDGLLFLDLVLVWVRILLWGFGEDGVLGKVMVWGGV